MKQRISTLSPAGYDLSDQPTSGSDLTELLLAARRQVWRIGGWAFLGLLLGGFHYATSPKEFTATSTILIEERQTNLEQEISAVLPSARTDANVVSQIQILRSLQLAAEVVNDINLMESASFRENPTSLIGGQISAARSWVGGLIPDPPQPETSSSSAPSQPSATPGVQVDRAVMDTAVRLRNRTEFSRVGRSFVVEISHTSHDPAIATAIVNAYADAYLNDGTQANIEASSRTAQWMQTQVDELRLAAQEAADDVVAFRAEFGAANQQGLRERTNRVEALNELLGTFQTRYQELVLEGTFPVQSGRILSRALEPRNPAYPKAWQLLGMGLVLGMLIGLTMAVIREGRETSFRTGGDVNRSLKVPFLGYVPRIFPRKLARQRAHPTLTAGTGAAHDATDAETEERPGMRTLSAPREFILSTFASGSDADRGLRKIFTTLETELPAAESRALAVGGLGRTEGAPRLAANLANLAARAGHSSLLIDGDFVGSFLSDRFGASEGPGLVDVLNGQAPVTSAIQTVFSSMMHVLPTGVPLQGRRRETIAPPPIGRFADLLATLRTRYSYIFLSLPPLDLYPEAKSLVHATDHLILNARWGQTRRRLLQDYLANETEIRRRVLGVVLDETQLKRLPSYGVSLSAAGISTG